MRNVETLVADRSPSLADAVTLSSFPFAVFGTATVNVSVPFASRSTCATTLPAIVGVHAVVTA